MSDQVVVPQTNAGVLTNGAGALATLTNTVFINLWAYGVRAMAALHRPGSRGA